MSNLAKVIVQKAAFVKIDWGKSNADKLVSELSNDLRIASGVKTLRREKTNSNKLA